MWRPQGGAGQGQQAQQPVPPPLPTLSWLPTACPPLLPCGGSMAPASCLPSSPSSTQRASGSCCSLERSLCQRRRRAKRRQRRGGSSRRLGAPRSSGVGDSRCGCRPACRRLQCSIATNSSGGSTWRTPSSHPQPTMIWPCSLRSSTQGLQNCRRPQPGSQGRWQCNMHRRSSTSSNSTHSNGGSSSRCSSRLRNCAGQAMEQPSLAPATADSLGGSYTWRLRLQACRVVPGQLLASSPARSRSKVGSMHLVPSQCSHSCSSSID